MNDVIAAVASELPAPEIISAHFHLGPDAIKIVNYAEWEDARSHRRSLDTGRLSRAPPRAGETCSGSKA